MTHYHPLISESYLITLDAIRTFKNFKDIYKMFKFDSFYYGLCLFIDIFISYASTMISFQLAVVRKTISYL